MNLIITNTESQPILVWVWKKRRGGEDYDGEETSGEERGREETSGEKRGREE